MLDRLTNTVVPKNKIVNVTDSDRLTEEENFILENHRCRQTAEEVIQKYLPEAKGVCIIWVDKEGMVSSAFCNIIPWQRMFLLFVVWMQELFDFDFRKKDGKKKRQRG